MAEHLHRELQELRQKVVYVGTLVEEALAKAVRALHERDPRMAHEIIDNDQEVDGMEVEVEEHCLKILALYQPVALDLRFVVAVLKINNDLERVGDLAKNIAKRILVLAQAPQIEVPGDFQQMSQLVQLMLKHSLDALVTSNTMLARQVRANDDQVDELRDQIQARVQRSIAQHPEDTDLYMKLFSVARHLERAADMTTHVAEEVIYMVDGDIVRHRAGA